MYIYIYKCIYIYRYKYVRILPLRLTPRSRSVFLGSTIQVVGQHRSRACAGGETSNVDDFAWQCVATPPCKSH